MLWGFPVKWAEFVFALLTLSQRNSFCRHSTILKVSVHGLWWSNGKKCQHGFTSISPAEVFLWATVPQKARRLILCNVLFWKQWQLGRKWFKSNMHLTWQHCLIPSRSYFKYSKFCKFSKFFSNLVKQNHQLLQSISQTPLTTLRSVWLSNWDLIFKLT